MHNLKMIGKVVGGSVVLGGTGWSLKSNDYDINSIGIVRFGRCATTAVDIGKLYKKNLFNGKLDKKSPEYEAEKKRTHKLAAEKILQLCCANKGPYIKMGQIIASLDYLVPFEYVNTMKSLYKNAPKNSVEDLYKVIREDLKKQPEEIFETFDPEPLGTASLAQVHRAVLKDGTVVAVKVQHSYVRGNILVDIKTVEFICKIMTWVFPDFNMQWLVDIAKTSLPAELDFLNEGKNAEKVKLLFKNTSWLKVPNVYWDLSSSRILTMDFAEGGQVNDLDFIQKNEMDPYDVSNKLGLLYSQMIFTHGFVHADPHPGNILIRKNSNGNADIILLDHGLYVNLTNRFRYDYSNLWLSILNADHQGMKYHSERLGVKSKTTDLYSVFVCLISGRPWRSVSKGLTNNQDENCDETEVIKNGISNNISRISDVLQTMDPQMLLILKTNDVIRGIESSLKVRKKMTAYYAMAKYCIKSTSQQEMEHIENIWKLCTKTVAVNWAIIKLNLYYLYRELLQLNFFNFKLLFT